MATENGGYGRCAGVTVGISGGLDSAVVAAICKKAFPANTLGLIMPCHSIAEDLQHARLVVEHLQIQWQIVQLDQIYDVFCATLQQGLGKEQPSTLAAANLKPRLRMTTLYFYAAQFNYLVVGTSNLSERAVGYFTKYGDGGVDLMPLGNLVKREVQELAYYFDIPEIIITKPPSGGLWPGQTDETEMGLTYAQLDAYLRGAEIDIASMRKIELMHKKSQHKRELPPIPQF